jgi:hypothetical protein
VTIYQFGSKNIYSWHQKIICKRYEIWKHPWLTTNNVTHRTVIIKILSDKITIPASAGEQVNAGEHCGVFTKAYNIASGRHWRRRPSQWTYNKISTSRFHTITVLFKNKQTRGELISHLVRFTVHLQTRLLPYTVLEIEIKYIFCIFCFVKHKFFHSKSEGFWRWCVKKCKIVLLDFVHHLNYKIINLCFRSWLKSRSEASSARGPNR